MGIQLCCPGWLVRITLLCLTAASPKGPNSIGTRAKPQMQGSTTRGPIQETYWHIQFPEWALMLANQDRPFAEKKLADLCFWIYPISRRQPTKTTAHNKAHVKLLVQRGPPKEGLFGM